MNSRHVVRGAGWMLGTQLAIGVAQFLVSAITARIFAPELFGTLAAALGLQGLLALLTTTGLPSFVLRQRELSAATTRMIRVLALAGGVVAGALYLLASPFWFSLLGVPEWGIFTALVLTAQFFGPIAAVESALLRRQKSALKDAVSLGGAFFISSAIGLVCVIVITDAWTLAVLSVLNSPVLLVLAWLLRRGSEKASVVLEHGTREPVRNVLKYAGKLSALNSMFFVLSQAPGWVLSARFGPFALGQFSRASTLAGIPSTSLSNALVRAIQPYWTHLRGHRSISKAFVDAALLASGVAFPIFAVLAATGPLVTEIWLGPGWELAGELVPWLAASYAVQVPFAVLSNAAEMRGQLRPIRSAQIALALGLIPVLIWMAISGSPILVGVALFFSQSCGLVTLVFALSWNNRYMMRPLFFGLFMQGVWGLAIGAAAFGALHWSSASLATWPAYKVLIELGASFAGGAAVLMLAWRWGPTAKVLRSRGIRTNIRWRRNDPKRSE